jgi:hypothetical protein
MARGGGVPLMTAVTNDVTAGVGIHLVPRARAMGRHLSVVPLPAHPWPVDEPEDGDPGALTALGAALEELGRTLDELAQRQGRRRLPAD